MAGRQSSKPTGTVGPRQGVGTSTRSESWAVAGKSQVFIRRHWSIGLFLMQYSSCYSYRIGVLNKSFDVELFKDVGSGAKSTPISD